MKFKLDSRFFLWLLFAYTTGYVIYKAGPIFVRGFDLGKLLSSAYLVGIGALATILVYRAHDAKPYHDEANGNDPDDSAQLQAECDALRNELSSVQKEADRLRAENAALLCCTGSEKADAVVRQIQGETFQKLVEVIEAFPAQYPNPEAAKLNDDIRPWIKEKTGCSDREVHVFGAIVAEHFSLRG
ncbi:MAG: hypothetical protein JSS57_25420 [Proteobacteria bacterium]|nr:hypothetical protein [Pseudomonadota bacterium]